MADNSGPGLRIAFVVGSFPEISQTFIINQIADLIDRGIQVEVFAYGLVHSEFVSSRYQSYRIDRITNNLIAPPTRMQRYFSSIPRILKVFVTHPMALIRTFNVFKYGRQALSLSLVYLIEPFVGKDFDLVHCHFGDNANRYLVVKDLLNSKIPIVTTFYGWDVSKLPRSSPADYYDRLKRECALFFVMSLDMKRRVEALGFPEHKIVINPVSIDVESYPFSERRCDPGDPVQLVSVGRFVEKKGFDDLFSALAKVTRMTSRPFRCSIIGAGPLEKELRALSSSLGIDGLIEYKGYMKNEDINDFLTQMHIMVQPSKTGSDGDME